MTNENEKHLSLVSQTVACMILKISIHFDYLFS